MKGLIAMDSQTNPANDIQYIPDKPGPELDILLAVEVLEWVPWEEKRGEYLYVVFQKPGERQPYRSTQNWEVEKERYKQIAANEVDRLKHIVCGLSDFSTTWEGMRLVVQEMNRRGYGFSLFCEDGEWSSDFWQWTSSDGTTHNTADDLEFAPHAVAVAAIKAIRGGEQQLP